MRHGILLLIASLLVACQPKVRDLAVPAVAPDTALALISTNAAYFVFPVERTPARGDPMAVSGGPAHMWTVDWWPPYTREGKDPHGIWPIIDRDPVGGTHPALADATERLGPWLIPRSQPACRTTG